MKFNLICISIFAMALAFSCSKEQQNLTKQLKITLIDEANNQPIDSAQITLHAMAHGGMDMWHEVYYTNARGLCDITFELKPQTDYKVIASKEGYWNYLIDDSASISRSTIRITEYTETEQILHLTSDPNQNNEFWRTQMPRYEMDSLIEVLRTDNFNSSFPLLIWKDIRQLLEVANDTTMITKFPYNMLSSYSQDSCYLGVVSLWLIESIRLTEIRGKYDFFGNLPSLNPILKYKDKTEFRYEINDLIEMKIGYDLYVRWWEEVKNLDPQEACKINPLEHSEIEW